MAGQYGVQESKEALLALVILGKFVADRLKDGIQLDDALALGQKLADEDFKSKVMAGIEGSDKIPAELKELDLMDLVELLKVVPDMLAVLNPPVAPVAA